jgi:hypothetical protein
VFSDCALRFVEQTDGSIVVEVFPEQDALAGRETTKSCKKKLDPKTLKFYCTEVACKKTCCAVYDKASALFTCQCK